MTLHADYINAIEARLRWMKWGEANQRNLRETTGFTKVIDTYLHVLDTGATYYMNPHFCALVDHARRCIPDDVRFEHTWMLSKQGWLWISVPFEVPETEQHWKDMQNDPTKTVPPMHVRAIGWQEIPEGEWIVPQKGEPERAPKGVYQFVCYQDMSLYRPDGWPAWHPWSYFVLRPGHTLIDRILEFEQKAHAQQAGDAYKYIDPEQRKADPLHEMRWIYAALHLMAQKLTSIQRHDTDRATRRRAERSGQNAPPFIEVVTLRRMEQDRVAYAVHDVNWQWQWGVVGHWRWQFYPSENTHKRIFIESYVKGPADKPLKPGTLKLFVAKR